MSSPHIERLGLLNARVGGIHHGLAVMPISMEFSTTENYDELASYDNIECIEGSISRAAIHYDGGANTYPGWIDGSTRDSQYLLERPSKMKGGSVNVFRVQKTDVKAFRYISGNDVVIRLQNTLREEKEGGLWLFNKNLLKAIEGHRQWAAVGGFTGYTPNK